MLQTLHPYPNADKTAEIMARYRPIAPRPADVLQLNPKMTTQSPPYLTNAWPAARPTRTRKRGRSSAVGPPPPHPTKRSRSTFLSASPQPAQTQTLPPLQPLLHSPNNAFTLGSLTPVSTQATLVTLPLLPCPTDFNVAGEHIIDLNTVAQEKDFLHLLQGPTTNNNNVVIAPQAVRPVGSSISIRSIRGNPDPTPEVKLVKKAEEVEEEIESERSPVVVTDSNNKVRVVNSAYKEMVGQPECLWLDSMVTCEGRHGGFACKRICGEVTLQFPPESGQIDSNGFSCWARIEWGSNGKKRSVDSACRAIRLYCESKDYLLAWRFNTREVFECPCY